MVDARPEGMLVVLPEEPLEELLLEDDWSAAVWPEARLGAELE